ncbi:hypothetical protein SAR11G3_01401 [Candidatus Pelagibacter sp. IMCC9063]|uniref:DUF2127 domain-containing protein n=1 Tax=Pelagibacter sp. (strain IMCC9063) TaxID=1002672 RepID=UPI0002046586|nr:DUF2127 domain-containing protein [Candidatus Pelagibacter sp. IMCC9063]AEA81876.1 hypothetical protein SAR11G3_01401 [Candidatus Pelagibacter sp. IMCC9063]
MILSSKKYGLKTIAVLRSIRGVGALLLATTLLYASFYKEESLEINTSLISENRFFEQIIHWFPQLTQEHFFAFAIIALLMSITRFVEAFGLWFEKNWGNYLTITTGLITSIILFLQLMNEFLWIVLFFLLINLLIACYLLIIVKMNKVFKRQKV